MRGGAVYAVYSGTVQQKDPGTGVYHGFVRLLGNSAGQYAEKDPSDHKKHWRKPEEGRALFAVLIQGQGPKAVSKHTGVELGRVYELRRAFLNAFPLF